MPLSLIWIYLLLWIHLLEREFCREPPPAWIGLSTLSLPEYLTMKVSPPSVGTTDIEPIK